RVVFRAFERFLEKFNLAACCGYRGLGGVGYGGGVVRAGSPITGAGGRHERPAFHLARAALTVSRLRMMLLRAFACCAGVSSLRLYTASSRASSSTLSASTSSAVSSRSTTGKPS